MNADSSCKLQMLRLDSPLVAGVEFPYPASISSDWFVCQILPCRSTLGWAYTVNLPLAAFLAAERRITQNLLILNSTSLLVASFKGHFEGKRPRMSGKRQ